MDNKKLRAELGNLVGAAFLISATYFIWSNTGFVSLISIPHISFLIFGYFITKLILGWLLFLLIKLLEKLSDFFGNRFIKFSPYSNAMQWVKFLGLITQLLIYLIIFYLTKNLYIHFFTAEYEIKHPPLMRTFHCTQFKNGFTLGKYSNPTNEQINDLCSCVESKLTETDKANLNSSINDTSINDIGVDNFLKSARTFGDSIKKCGEGVNNFV